MTRPRNVRLIVAAILVATLSGCGSDGPEASDLGDTPSANNTGTAGRGIFEDSGLAQEDLMGFPEINAARAALSPELLAAAKAGGDLACGLPPFPGANARESLPGQPGFVSSESPATVAAFYWAAADAAGGFAMVGATPSPFARIHLPDGRNCHVSARTAQNGSDFIVTDQGYLGLVGEGGN